MIATQKDMARGKILEQLRKLEQRRSQLKSAMVQQARSFLHNDDTGQPISFDQMIVEFDETKSQIRLLEKALKGQRSDPRRKK